MSEVTTSTETRTKDEILKRTLYEMYVVDWKRTHDTNAQMELDSMRNYLIECEESDGDFYESFEDYLNDAGYGNGCLPSCYDEFLDCEFTDKDYMKALIEPDSCDKNKKIYEHYLALLED